MRRSVSPAENAQLIASFVMGVELVLILVYVRMQVVSALKGAVERTVASELARPGAYLGKDPPAARPNFERLYASLSLDGEHRTGVLTCFVYFLTAVIFVVSIVRMGDFESVPRSSSTSIASALAGLSVFAASQWGFLKLVVLPHYARLFNQITGSDIPAFEADEARVTFLLLGPAFAFLIALSLFAFALSGQIEWGVVGVTVLIAVASVSTEVVSWGAITGFSVPMESVVSAVADSVTAVLWVNRDNPPEVALERLHEALFPDASSSLSPGNILQTYYREAFDRKRLVLDPSGDLAVASAPSGVLQSAFLLACAIALILAPIVAVAVRGLGMDAAVFAAQIACVTFVYAVFVRYSEDTETMKRIVTL